MCASVCRRVRCGRDDGLPMTTLPDSLSMQFSLSSFWISQIFFLTTKSTSNVTTRRHSRLTTVTQKKNPQNTKKKNAGELSGKHKVCSEFRSEPFENRTRVTAKYEREVLNAVCVSGWSTITTWGALEHADRQSPVCTAICQQRQGCQWLFSVAWYGVRRSTYLHTTVYETEITLAVVGFEKG